MIIRHRKKLRFSLKAPRETGSKARESKALNPERKNDLGCWSNTPETIRNLKERKEEHEGVKSGAGRR